MLTEMAAILIKIKVIDTTEPFFSEYSKAYHQFCACVCVSVWVCVSV